MKRKHIFLLVATTLLFAACGVGTYSVNSGSPDQGAICIVANDAYDVTLRIDGKDYPATTVKQKAYKKRRNIKATAREMHTITPGQHEVTVLRNGTAIYSHKVFVSAGETKLIEL